MKNSAREKQRFRNEGVTGLRSSVALNTLLASIEQESDEYELYNLLISAAREIKTKLLREAC